METNTTTINKFSKTETCCRACTSSDLNRIFDFGSTPLANSLLNKHVKDTTEELKFPLVLVYCKSCSLVQITETVSPEILFKNYFYFSSFAETTLLNAKILAEKLCQKLNLTSNSLVAEIASNDGYLLQNYAQKSIPVLGIEPAQNIAEEANKKGINTICEFFGSKLAQKLVTEGQKADLIHANNVLAHVSDLNGFVLGIAELLKETGTAVIEVPYLKSMLKHTEFDTIYHEHLCYFSLTALKNLFNSHNLYINDLELLDIHGGSLRLYIGKNNKASKIVLDLLSEEMNDGIYQESYYANFANKIASLKKSLLEFLQELKSQGKRIAVYGASAKGSTLMNYFGIDNSLVDYVVDRSTVKQNHLTPGNHLSIYSPEKLLLDKPDYVLLLTWNFANEILQQQQEYRNLNGKFIIPIPELKIV